MIDGVPPSTNEIVLVGIAFAFMGFWLASGRMFPGVVRRTGHLVGIMHRDWLARICVWRVTDLAALIAGRKRLSLREEWRAHLAGESGHDPVTLAKVRQALGFIAAAARYRFADATELAWRPADALLGSRTLSNLFVWGPVIVVLVTIVRHDGWFGLVADDQDPVALGAFLYLVIKTGRWWRGVKPPKPKAWRAKE